MVGEVPRASPSLGSGRGPPRIVRAIPLPVTGASPRTIKGLEAKLPELVAPGLHFRLYIALGFLDFLILHLQLNLVNLQLVDEPLRVSVGPSGVWFRVLLLQA